MVEQPNLTELDPPRLTIAQAASFGQSMFDMIASICDASKLTDSECDNETIDGYIAAWTQLQRKLERYQEAYNIASNALRYYATPDNWQDIGPPSYIRNQLVNHVYDGYELAANAISIASVLTLDRAPLCVCGHQHYTECTAINEEGVACGCCEMRRVFQWPEHDGVFWSQHHKETVTVKYQYAKGDQPEYYLVYVRDVPFTRAEYETKFGIDLFVPREHNPFQ